MNQTFSMLTGQDVLDFFFDNFVLDLDASYDVIFPDDENILIHRTYPMQESAKAAEIARNYVHKKFQQNKDNGKFVVWNACNSVLTCTIYTDRKATMGYAKCRPGDKNIPEIGKALAYSRASGEPLPKPLAAYLNID